MNESFEKAKKILITVEESADLDKIVAAIELAKNLDVTGKEIQLLLPINNYTKRIFKIFPLGDLKIIQKNDPQSYIVSLQKDDALIKNVKWDEEKGKINIYISTESGNLPSDKVSIKPNYALFDLIVLVGVGKLNNLGEFYKTNQKAFPRNKIIQIGDNLIDKTSSKLGFQKFSESSTSLSELVYKFLEELKRSINSDSLTNLLAGILWRTDGLNHVDTNDTAHTISNLIKKDADLKSASKKAFRVISWKDSRLIDQVFKNLEIIDERIALSIIRNANRKSLSPDEIIASNWNFFDRFDSCETGIVIIEEATEVIIILTSREQNLFEKIEPIRGNYSMSGDKFTLKLQRKMTEDDSIENLRKEILGLFTEDKSKSSKKEVSEAKAAKTETPKDPLESASEPPKPLQLETHTAEEQGGFTPPPPMNPLPSVNKQN